MAAQNPPVNGVAFTFYVKLPDFAIPGKDKVNPTVAAGDVKLIIDGVASTLGAAGSDNLITLPVVTPAGSAWVKVALAASEMTGDNIGVQFLDQTSPQEWSERSWTIQTTAAGSGGLTQADVRTAVGLAAANLDTQLVAIKTDVDAIPSTPAPTAIQNADAYLDRVNGIETGLTPRQAMRLEIAALLGKLSGAGSNTIAIRDINDTVDRIVATVDSFGDRTAVTTNVT